ncbi:hypothetical protein [uncultured Dubosiella sp.]|uniref:hypothetical protein n=1 Tax=uncultured Dubosiella sp. TaxID=1937011 RepID=UPI0025B0BE8F|nr:hypothetical protein [uncultured Dubosiella sp.]
MKKKIWMGVVIFLLLAGCKKGITIGGTWVDLEDPESTFWFYDEGKVLDVPKESTFDELIEKWSIEKDGTLTLESETGTIQVYKISNDQDQALKNSGYYYLDENTLILDGREYERTRSSKRQDKRKLEEKELEKQEIAAKKTQKEKELGEMREILSSLQSQLDKYSTDHFVDDEQMNKLYEYLTSKENEVCYFQNGEITDLNNLKDMETLKLDPETNSILMAEHYKKDGLNGKTIGFQYSKNVKNEMDMRYITSGVFSDGKFNGNCQTYSLTIDPTNTERRIYYAGESKRNVMNGPIQVRYQKNNEDAINGIETYQDGIIQPIRELEPSDGVNEEGFVILVDGSRFLYISKDQMEDEKEVSTFWN